MGLIRSAVTVALTLFLAAPLRAQADPVPSFFEGIQGSLNAWQEHASDDLGPAFRQAVWAFWLLSSDISMTMNASRENEVVDFVGNLFVAQGAREGSIYAEFDRENGATSMRFRDSGGLETVGLRGGPRTGLGLVTMDQNSEDFTMYFDSEGTAYVPLDSAVVGEGSRYGRVPFMDMSGGMASALEVSVDQAIEAGITNMVDDLIMLSSLQMRPLDLLRLPQPLQDLLGAYGRLVNFDPESRSWEPDNVNDELRRWAEAFRAGVDDLPVIHPLIHFAYILTPNVVRERGNVREEAGISWRGLEQATRFTVTSGSQRGYVLVFDRYGRLVYLQDEDGDTATYGYDRDLRVVLPS